MRTATLSILGMYNYDNTVFENFVVPSQISLDDVRDSIFMECAELELVYPALTTMKQMIGVWSRKNLSAWQKLYDTTQVEYDPISNYDRKEEWTDDNKVDRSRTDTGTSRSTGNSSGNGTTTESQTSFNSNAFADTQQVVSSDSQEVSSSGNSTLDSDEHETGNKKRTGRAYGNIGVTTTQQMLEQERAIVQFNVIDVIVRSFKDTFCILVY